LIAKKSKSKANLQQQLVLQQVVQENHHKSI